MQPVPAQIEESIFEADILRVFGLAKYRQWQLLGLRQYLQRGDTDLNIACWQFGIDRFLRTRIDAPVHTDHPLRVQDLGFGEFWILGLYHALGQTVVITQVNKQQSPVVTHTMHPSRKTHFRANIAFF